MAFVLVGMFSFPVPTYAQTNNTASTDQQIEFQLDPVEASNADGQEFAVQPLPQSQVWWMLAGYSILITSASLLGGWLPGRVRLTHVQFQLVLSLVGGLLLGIGIFHLWSHSIHQLGVANIDTACLWLMAGIIMMFFLLRAFHVHHHEPEVPIENGSPADTPAHDHDHDGDHSHVDQDDHRHPSHVHGEHCAHGHSAEHHAPQGKLGWAGLFLGLGLHTLLDGVALGASMQAAALHGAGPWLGLGVLMGIVLHKPFDSLSIVTLMINANCTRRQCFSANVAYSLLCPLGAALFLLGISTVSGNIGTAVGCSLAFSAGIFICIALSDLLPEMEFHTHHRWQLSFSLLAGIALAWAIQFVEPAHFHG